MLTSFTGAYLYTFLSQTLYLLPQKAIFWKEKGILLLADVHLGKVNHFRKAGIAVPATLASADYTVLNALLAEHAVREVVFLGDLFHSTANAACSQFIEWIQAYPQIVFKLVKGNHDILPEPFYASASMHVYENILIIPPFIFSHTPVKEQTPYYNLTGHIHPAVTLVGKGRQILTLPCYYFGEHMGILPAFGSFTGRAVIEIKAGDVIFALVNNTVTALNTSG